MSKKQTGENKPRTAKAASKYEAAELAANARRVFGKPPEVVSAALKAAGKTAATLDEAKETVSKFLQREVK